MKKLSKTLVAFVLVALIAVVASVNTVSAAESVFPKGYEKIPVSRRIEIYNKAFYAVAEDGYEPPYMTEEKFIDFEKSIDEYFIEHGEFKTKLCELYVKYLGKETGTSSSLFLVQKADTWKVISSGTKIYAKQLVKPVSENAGKVTYKFDDGSEYKTVSTTGEKEFTVVATDAEGNKAEKTVTVNCKKGDRPLMTLYNFDVTYNSKNKTFYTYTKAGVSQYDRGNHYDGILSPGDCDNYFIATDCNGDLIRVTNNAKDVIPKKFKTGQSKTITFIATDKYNNVSKAKVKVTAISAKKWEKEYKKSYSKYIPYEKCDGGCFDKPETYHAKIFVQVKGTKVVKEVLNSYTKKKITKNGYTGYWYTSDYKGTDAFISYCCDSFVVDCSDSLYKKIKECGFIGMAYGKADPEGNDFDCRGTIML